MSLNLNFGIRSDFARIRYFITFVVISPPSKPVNTNEEPKHKLVSIDSAVYVR